MRKQKFAIVVLCMLFLPSLVAYADLIVEPENDFYASHQSQLIYLGRSFSANGEHGSVAVKKEPGARSDTASITNDEAVDIEYSCLYDGNFWGFASAYSGWVRLDEMLVLYDYVAFAEDNVDKLYSYDGDYAEIKDARSAIAWPWPGADAYLWSLEDLDAESFTVSCAYRDAAGREWGFVPYLYGSRNIWICLSDPLNREIPAFNAAPEPGVWVPETEYVDIKQNAQEEAFSPLVVSAILVVTLVLVTMILIRIFWKPNKESGGKKQ